MTGQTSAFLTAKRIEEGLSRLDLHFARLMERLSQVSDPGLTAVAALASRATREGHVCLDLRRLRAAGQGSLSEEAWNYRVGRFAWLGERPERLLSTAVVGRPGERRPMILDDAGRLYLYRYWAYENDLVQWVRRRSERLIPAPDTALVRAILNRLFPQGETPDWQQAAALTALLKPFCIISGGPGTGKTTTVARILALLLELGPPQALRVRLAAPTGKAAARLQESISTVRKGLAVDPAVRERIPGDVSTVHRLLGSIAGSPYFRHNAAHPLTADVVVVDEASMLDLALMSKLTAALPEDARLILLGDKDQLASVEAGAVLGDLCDQGRGGAFSPALGALLEKTLDFPQTAGENEPMLSDCIIELRKNYRFGERSGIGAVSAAVKEGAVERALACFNRSPQLVWRSAPPAARLMEALKEAVLSGYGPCLEDLSEDGLFERFDRFRILSPVREGPYGVVHLNRVVRSILERAGWAAPGGVWYPGRPVMVTRNDYRLRLFNGDVGITVPDAEAEGGLRVVFPGAQGVVRRFHPLRLPTHETVYAMTVHKAQGSEFDEVLLVLPDRDNPLMTRELIYTALTRARRRVAVLGDEALFAAAAGRRIERSSGLRDALWGVGASPQGWD